MTADLRDQLQASLGAAYALERELGGGGMSRVFVAQETALGRHVVIKVLPPDLTGGVNVERFKREIALAARLQHAHIVPLLSAGEAGGLLYYTMPLIRGDSLRARLAREGELPVGTAVGVLRDVAKALAYAHREGVIHRDIKPENILLSEHDALVADFGVAKALSAATTSEGRASRVTTAGMALGTPAYMAPEQAAGDPAVDHRADLYALGVVAYEVLTGAPPFAGRPSQALLAAHATEPPEPVVKRRPTLPRLLTALVMRLLEKRPADRPQSAEEVLRELDAVVTSGSASAPMGVLPGAVATARAPRTRTVLVAVAIAAVVVILVTIAVRSRARANGSADGEIRSVAVLPFENTSGDTTFAYLEDGITDHVRDALNAIPGLTVKARSSSRQLKGRDAREVGAKLGVGAVLQGTVSRSNARLHVTAELVRVSDDGALWSSTFDGQPSEVAGMQDTITRAVAGKLHLAGAGAHADRRAGTSARGTADIEAYDRFLQGHYAFDRLDFGRASALFREAVARDPRFARAHAYLAMSYANAPTLGLESVDSMNVLARTSANLALALDSSVAEAYAAQSFILANEMRFAEAVWPLEKAVRIDSSNADILAAYGAALGQIGRVEEGLVQARRARERDPLSGTAVSLLGYALGLSRQYDAAIATLEAALDLEPKNVLVHQELGLFFAFDGQPDSAVAALETAFKLNPTLWGGRSNLVFGYAVAGRWRDAARQRVLLDREVGGNSPNYHRMVVDLAYGDYDAAMTALERGVVAREALLGIVSIPCDPLFDPLKADPRFAALMERLGARACPATGTWPIARRPR